MRIKITILTFLIVILLINTTSAFEVSGEIIYEDGGFGVYVVAMYETIGLPAHLTFTLWPGEYSIDNVDSGTYFVMAFKDENTNLLPDVSEPMGFYQDSFLPILVVEDDVDSVNIELGDTGGNISGQVEPEDGVEEGQFIVLPLSQPEPQWLYIQGFPYVEESTEYTTQVFADGDYYIGGWRDTNMNYFRDESEPFGFFGGTDPFQITIEDLQDVEGIDFILYYPDSTTSVNTGSWGDIKTMFNE